MKPPQPRTWKLVLAALLLLVGMALPALAQPGRQHVDLVLLDYDLDSTSYVYPVLGQRIIPGPGRAQTSGSSATVTAGATSTNPFDEIGVGDVIYFSPGSVTDTVLQRRVTAKASATSITVDSAVDLSGNGTTGVAWEYQHFSTGTAITNGWFNLPSPTISSAVMVEVSQLNVTGGIDVRIECRMEIGSGNPVSAFYRNVTTAGIGAGTTTTDTGIIVYEVLPHFRQCRVGLKIGGADDGDDTGANAEKITVKVTSY